MTTDELTTELISRAWGITSACFWMPTSGLNPGLPALRWIETYHRQGTRYATETGESAILRQLVADGYMEATGGKTKAAAHKLTWRGLCAALPGDEGSPTFEDYQEWLESLAKRGGRVEGWKLCDHAASWANGSAAALDAYLDELDTVQDFTLPLEAAGFIRSIHAAGPFAFWNVEITDAGRAFLQSPERHELGTAFDIDAWETGWRIGRDRFVKTCPNYDNWYPHRTGPELWAKAPATRKATK